MKKIKLSEKMILNNEDGDFRYWIFLDDFCIGEIISYNSSISSFMYMKINIIPEYRHLGYGTKALDILYSISKVKQIFIQYNERVRSTFLEDNNFKLSPEYLCGTLYCKDIIS